MNRPMINACGVPAHCEERAAPVAHFLRLTHRKGEGYRLPPECRGVRVYASRAWLTVGGEDKVVSRGETIRFEPDRYGAVISPLDDCPLVVELLRPPREPERFAQRLRQLLGRNRRAV